MFTKLKTLPRLMIGLQASLFALSATAEVREIRSMRELPSFTVKGERTILVFDLDNTIIEAAQTLGSDQWFDHLVKRFTDAGEARPVDHAIALWTQVAAKTRVRPVESLTPRLIASAQAAGIPVIGLTARRVDVAETTEAQLASVGVRIFSKSLPPALRSDIDFGDGAKRVRGITYVGPTVSKGEAITRILKASGLRPDRIVFADDKVKHVNSVDQALNAFPGLTHWELRYGAADPRVASYDERIAAIQERAFAETGRILSDEEASQFGR